MVLAPLSLASRYASLHPLMGPAFDWLARLPERPGRYAIRGDELFANLDEGMTRPTAECRFESHRRYIDIQVSLAGGELIDWAPVSELEVAQDFQPGGDVAFYRPPPEPVTRLLVRPGFFAVFFPEDAHRPLCAIDAPAAYRKCVLKLAVDAT